MKMQVPKFDGMKKVFLTILLCSAAGLALCASLRQNIHFATPDLAKTLLKTEDEYTKRWGRFDLECRMQKVVSAYRLKLPFPDTIYLINVKRTENSKGEGFAYTRRNFMVLNADEELVVHELFHVLSRNAPELRARLYATIGFRMMPELILPQEMKDRQILNPDAPIIDSYITLKKDSISVNCAAWTYTNEPYNGGKRYAYKQVGLILLNDRKEIAYENGKAVIYGVNELTEYWEQVGRNTRYIDQPDEILAVNFVYFIMGKAELKSPWVVEKMREIFRK